MALFAELDAVEKSLQRSFVPGGSYFGVIIREEPCSKIASVLFGRRSCYDGHYNLRDLMTYSPSQSALSMA